jgi:uncharacterized membrane protein
MLSTFKIGCLLLFTSVVMLHLFEILIHKNIITKKFHTPKFIKFYQSFQIILTIVLIIIHGILTFRVKHIILFLGLSISIGTLAELFILKTGLVGKLSYTDKLKPKLFGVLPIYMPFMWTLLTYFGLWMTIFLLHDPATTIFDSLIQLIIIAPLLITMLDLCGDPIAIDEGFWVWETKGKYLGIPILNFIGWYITAGLIIIPFSFYVMPLKIESVPIWVLYSPAFGYYFYCIMMTKTCYDKKLNLPGKIGLILTIGLTIWGLLKL